MTPKNKNKNALVRNAACVAIASMASMSLLGCSAGTRTRVDPATTDATHGTRIERPGRTKTKTFELEILPSGFGPSGATGWKPIPPESIAPESASMEMPVGSLVAFVGHADATSRPAEPVVRPVGWVKHGKASQDQIDPTIAGAIAQAARNGHTVKLKITDTEEIPLTADVSNSTLSDRGAGLDTRSDEAAIGFDGSKSGSKLPWGGRSGKTSWGLDASLLSQGVNPMHIIGAIVMLGAIIPILVPPRRWVTAGLVAGVGLLIIAAGTVSEEAPWVFVLAILGFLGVAGWLGYEAWRNKRRGITLSSVVRGIENSNNFDVKSSIGKAAGEHIETVKSEITAMKKKAKVSLNT